MVTLSAKKTRTSLICSCMHLCTECIAARYAYQTSQHVATKHRSELYCGSENNSNLTAVMSGLPSSQHAQDLTELCSSKYGIITRALDEPRCVALSEGGTRHADSRRLVKSSSEERICLMPQLLPRRTRRPRRLVGCSIEIPVKKT